jgi:hypothetical protein
MIPCATTSKAGAENSPHRPYSLKQFVAYRQRETEIAVDARCPSLTAETTYTPVRLTRKRTLAEPELLVRVDSLKVTDRPFEPPSVVALRRTMVTRVRGAKPVTLMVKLFDRQTFAGP